MQTLATLGLETVLCELDKARCAYDHEEEDKRVSRPFTAIAAVEARIRELGTTPMNWRIEQGYLAVRSGISGCSPTTRTPLNFSRRRLTGRPAISGNCGKPGRAALERAAARRGAVKNF